jgi:phage replication-related protein YjqB (UPF0714/DUF867 family)
MADKYASFAALARQELADSWRIRRSNRIESKVLIIAPHGGGIERGTSELAAMIAADDHSFYCFEGLKHAGNRDLHITSHRFDEPTALALIAQSSIIIGVHGCEGKQGIYVGGLDQPLVARLTEGLVIAGLPASSQGHGYKALDPKNICNRGHRRCGAQLEITRDLRAESVLPLIARATRLAIVEHEAAIAIEP